MVAGAAIGAVVYRRLVVAADKPAGPEGIGEKDVTYMRRGLARVAQFVLFVQVCSVVSAQVPAGVEAWSAEAMKLEEAGELSAALEAWNQAIALDAGIAGAYVRRGQVHFKMAHIDESVVDFDRAVELDPSSEPYLWQRGIAQFYAGQYDACRRQFEDHRSVNPNDVENAVWHFLCLARGDGVEVAQAALLPVGPDSRMPLRTIYELYRGRSSAAEVMAVAASASPDRRESALFYGELYVGLHHFILGDATAALEALRAAGKRNFPHYMRDVALVHVLLMAERLQSPVP